MREITLQELAALAENAKGEIRRIYLHWTAGHYNNTYDDYHLNITGDGTVWSSCGKLTEYKEHTWHRNSGAVAVSICCCARRGGLYRWQCGLWQRAAYTAAVRNLGAGSSSFGAGDWICRSTIIML